MTIDAERGTSAAVGEEVDRLRRSVRELSVLNDLAYAVGASSDFDFVLRTVLHRSAEAVAATEGVIALVDADGGDSANTLVRTLADRTAPPHHMNEHLLGWMSKHKRPIRLDRARSTGRPPGMDWDPSVASILCVPLMARGRLIGTLTVINKTDGDAFTVDDERLLAIIGSQSAQILENARHLEQERRLAALQHDLRVAARIQAALMPVSTPAIAGFDLAGCTVPARTVGGDYFDYVPLTDGRWAILVADVSGKGLPASLLVANLQATVRGLLHSDLPLDECVGRANALMCERSRDETFVTLFAAILDPGSGMLTYCNAGHNPPLKVSADGAIERFEPTGMVLGVLPSVRYDARRVPLGVHDRVLLYSDGISEAEDAHGREFGDERLAQLLRGCTDGVAGRIVDRVLDAIAAHTEGAGPASDDRTVVVLTRVQP